MLATVNQYIEQKAEQLLTDAGLYAAPVAVFEAATFLNIKIEELDLEEDVSGFYVIKDKSAHIGYNKSNPPVRIRFTIAHELGHYLLHAKQNPLFIDKPYNRNANSSTGKNVLEREANAFAAALLMPEKLINEYIDKFGANTIDQVIIRELARNFEVSEQAMTIRLTNLGLIDYYAFAS